MESIIAMPKYETYKDSGYVWIGKIPVDWEISRLGACLTPISIKNHPDLPLLSITRELGVIERDIEDQESNHNYIPDDLSGYKLLKKGQFGMNKMKAWQGSYGVSEYTGIVSPAYFIFDFAKAINPEFFNWAIRSKLYVSYFGSASDGVRIGQWDLSKTRMKDIPFILPEEKQQELIAKFLDKKTSQIDEAISIKYQQIGLLKERKQIIIQQAVTKGLDPNVPMKGSCLDWIGKIPKHWEICVLKRILKDHRQGFYTTEKYIDYGVKLARITDIKDGILDYKDMPFVKISQKDERLFSFRKGDFLFGRTGAGVGKFCKVVEEQRAVFASYLIKFSFDLERVSENFLELFFNSELFLSGLFSSTHGGANQNIHAENVKEQIIFLPPLEEQREIYNSLVKELEDFTRVSNSLRIQIEKLKEYKTSLINSAITGKIKITPEMVEG
ncbi:TPA: restriction endonuclease subunit S [Vibrio vulnificus]|nr:restriction endonuclease subunit S [Vibrio vulnificus]